MLSDEFILRLAAQVQGLELVLKTSIAMQYASGVKDEAGFARAAEHASNVNRHLQEHIGTVISLAGDNETTNLFEPVVRETVNRCLAGAEQQLRMIADVILEVRAAASNAQH